MAGRLRNVCFTLNNPHEHGGMIMFDEDKMDYLVYQEEIGEEGTYHFQGYCEFSKQMSQAQAKALLGGDAVHLAPRRGTAEQAANYCKKQYNDDGTDKRIAGTEPYEDGMMKQQGKRMDLLAFKDAVAGGARLTELVEDHYMTIARYPRFYQTLTFMNSPVRTQELQVVLLIGATGTGKTRSVYDAHGTSEDFWRAPITNGTMWFDTYDGHKTVLFDDFGGASSHVALRTLLQLLDRYPNKVPTKGGHVWFMPTTVFITANTLPKLWYKWGDRVSSYYALARRFTAVLEYYVSLPGDNSSYTEATLELEAEPPYHRTANDWWEQNKPEQVPLQLHGGGRAPTHPNLEQE